MKYAKPEIRTVSSALDAIQSDQVKVIHRVLDSTMTLAATAAYEADE